MHDLSILESRDECNLCTTAVMAVPPASNQSTGQHHELHPHHNTLPIHEFQAPPKSPRHFTFSRLHKTLHSWAQRLLEARGTKHGYERYLLFILARKMAGN